MKQRVLFAALFIDFVAFTIWVGATIDWNLGAMWADLVASPAIMKIGMQVGVDLCIAMSFVIIWMWKDAKRRGMNPLPFALSSLVLGSIVPLFYMVVRKPLEAKAASPQGAPHPLSA